MKRRTTSLRKLAGLAFLAVCLAGCAPTLTPMRKTAVAPDFARVVYLGADSDILKFEVFNDSQYVLVVDRDSVRLRLADGSTQDRYSGGAETFYSIPPGATHRVNVRYDFSDVKSGDVVGVLFQGALTIRGHVVPIAPVTFQAE